MAGLSMADVGRRTDAPESRLFVGSEIGALRRVIVHRPGGELRRVTGQNKRELLFDEVVCEDRARHEHDAFVRALRSRGAEVLYLDELLAETLAVPTARESVIRQTLRAERPTGELRSLLAAWLRSIPADELGRLLITGIASAELPFAAEGEGFVLRPLPNHVYTRDTSAWAYGGVSVHRMATPARRREAIHFDAIYRYHPIFADGNYVRWNDRLASGESLEGGDILVVGRGCILVGFGERTKPAAVECYARRLLSSEAVSSVIAIGIPARRSTIHLDTVMTMVDVDAFVVNPVLEDKLVGYRMVRSRSQLSVTREEDLFGAIARALGVSSLRLLSARNDSEREHWSLGNNTLALAPGVVVAYDHNTATNARLESAGIEVMAVPGAELARGHGGPRCMSCPIERD